MTEETKTIPLIDAIDGCSDPTDPTFPIRMISLPTIFNFSPVSENCWSLD